MDIPRRAKFQGRIVNILYYEGDDYFRILDRESQRSEHRDNLVFIK